MHLVLEVRCSSIDGTIFRCCEYLDTGYFSWTTKYHETTFFGS